MIDTFKAKTSGKKLIIKRMGMMTYIAEPQPGKKPKLIDIAFGNYSMIVNDLRDQGYQVITI